jgi:hypothetical protein
LADSSAEYLVVGGWAVGVHAEPRFTKDLDLLIGPDGANAFARFGAPTNLVEQLRRLGPEEFLFLGTPPARVDVLRAIPGVDFATAYARRLRVDWDGVMTDVIGRDDLLEAKRAAGRERDFRDVRAIEKSGPRR